LQQQKGALSSSFRHLYITSINHHIAFSCHSDFGCIAKSLCSYAVGALPFGALHYARIMRATAEQSALTRSQAFLAVSFRLILIKYLTRGVCCFLIKAGVYAILISIKLGRGEKL